MVEQESSSAVPALPAESANAVEAASTATPANAPANPVAASLEKKSDLSYFHAHARPREDLSNAQHISGEGLCNTLTTGVEAVDENDPRYFERKIPDAQIILLKKFLFEDGDKAVKVHVEFETDTILKNGRITKCEYYEYGMVCEICLEKPPPTGEAVGKKQLYRWEVSATRPFHNPVVPGECKYRISSDKKRLVFTLGKLHKDAEAWPELFRREISQHTGWE